MNTVSKPIPTSLSAGDRALVAIWRHGLLPLFAGLRGMAAPAGRVSEKRYGSLPDETMDVISPPSNVTERLPVVFVHGGGWIGGSKGRFYHRPLLGLADAGHVVFSLNYPLAPEMPHPYGLRSLLGALAALHRDGRVSNGIHLVGDSAGGNLATMLGLMLANNEILRVVDDVPRGPLPRVVSVASIYGVLDRTSWLSDGFPSARLFLKSYAGEAALDAAQTPPIPVTPMDVPDVENIPPTFIGIGSKDKLARTSQIYSDHLRGRGARVTYKTYEGADHGFYCFAEPQGDALRADVIQFLADVEASGGQP